ncbi:xanthine dehydrogenase [Pseudomonas sp. FW215-R2]|uniref:FAD binding domain-containing protein n=1 Tax=unclassified Pseudomonas TaxID=196821 RepID=UPI000C87EFCB|nr:MULTISPECIES: xanthine dehydrogenase family protein subunit M [unclassified Pseudomonas]PMX03117.1 xanthine dehydrogenase [Pseudomonas sp. FW215-R2]PMX11918.1 xanthine dehydrogenase [Pseudomonas sp. FW215-L1]PMX25588.1 xanthine dehydrogenase [Pseudomonas sp. FW215-E1]PNA32590.1 xanthine dehydrogenase [Pseudomonas sp. FW215-R4]
MRTFDYARAQSPAQAINSHAAPGLPFYLAGGTTLLDLVKLNVMQPDRLVDINHLTLKQIEPLADGRVRIGALVSNTELANHSLIRDHYAVLSQAILAGASTQLRNKATTGGNVMQRVRCNYFRDGVSPCNKRQPGSGCAAMGGHNRSVHAVLGTSERCIATHPSDMCVAMAAIGAQVTVQGPNGIREIPFGDFHMLPGQTPWVEHALEPHELITHVTLDAPLVNSRSAYLKLRDRDSYQFALASSAVIVVMDGRRITDARIALGGVGTKPWRALEAERALVGQKADIALFTQVGERAMQGARAYEHNTFKIPLGQQVVIRNLRDLTA